MGEFREKVGVRTRRNFMFYRQVFERLGPWGGTVWVDPCPIGRTALQAFSKQDNEGGGPYPCSEAPLLRKVLAGKKTINLFVSIWAEGIVEGLFWIEEFQEDFPWFPEWVWNAVQGQIRRIRNDRQKRIEAEMSVPEREFTQLDWVMQATGPSWRWDIVKGLPSKPRDEDLLLVEVA